MTPLAPLCSSLCRTIWIQLPPLSLTSKLLEMKGLCCILFSKGLALKSWKRKKKSVGSLMSSVLFSSVKKRKTRRGRAKGCCCLNGAHNSSFFSLFSAFVVHLHCSALPDLLSDLCFKEGMMEVEDSFFKLISRAMRTLSFTFSRSEWFLHLLLILARSAG